MELFRKKKPSNYFNKDSQLQPYLSLKDLTFLGIGAVIGAGIFILTGIVAARYAGPAIILSFILAGCASCFSAFCYAELAAALGGCGSAYGYAYAGFGEFIAWIVGWDLILEYMISVSTVAVGWGDYLNSIFLSMHVHILPSLLKGYFAGGLFNVLAMLITVVISIILLLGIKTSARFNNGIVLLKLTVILVFILVALPHFDIKHWHPFMPFGWDGVIRGASVIFFAYIGFDAVSTAAEEVSYPQRDLPRGIIGALLICTVLYIVVSGLLTGIISYQELNVNAPISHALMQIGYRGLVGLVSVGALAGLTTVILVMFYGLTRVFLAMARDGLLPSYFAKLSSKTSVPSRIIVLTGIIITLIAASFPMNELAELVNVGTLFAFIIVCSGVLVMRYTEPHLKRPFKIIGMPYIPILGISCCLFLMLNLAWMTLLRFLLWFLIGLCIYFSYGKNHSVLNHS